MSYLINASGTIVDGKRRLNAVVQSGLKATENYLTLGGRRVQTFDINKSFRTIPFVYDSAPTEYDDSSALLGGKVFDISKSGPNKAYCLAINNTMRDSVPVRYIKADDISLPINQYGDVIFANVDFPSPFEIVDEDVFYWLGKPMRLVQVSLMGWYPVIQAD